MHVSTSSFARSAMLLCAFALLSCTASGDETSRTEAASTTVDAGGPGSLFAGGAGTETSPYQVATCAQLQALQTALYAHFVFIADIDCTGFDAGDGRGFRPIGRDAEEFGGRVNGDGHLITGLVINRPNQDRVGLFGRTRWAVLQNFGLLSPSVRGRDDVGAVTGWQRWGLVEQVFVRDALVVGRERVGAFVGHMHHAKVYDSYAQAELTCTKWDNFHGGGQSRWNRACGQLVGTTVHGTVRNSYAAVDGASHFGLAGGSSPRTHTAAFYDCVLTGGCNTPHVERRTTTELQSEPYLVARQWDFDNVWGIAAPATYPCLQWEPGCSEPVCAANDVTCDGQDDDCDGTADDDFAPSATTCGVGACGSTGTTSCVSGSVVDSCEAGTPTATDATCDGVDNDCDALVDEGYASTATSCGVGACGATGATTCVSGAVVDSCEAGTPTGTDATCNAVDDDCDGDVDEAYAPAATSCGVGACGSTGTTSCVSGSVVDSCEAGTPTGTDATCDGVDNDCDASTDEAYASTATSCGVGACGATGATSCVSGVVVDSCETGTPTGTDTTCDAVDDDCDGDVDEAFAPAATSCGVGACGSTGTTSCVSGSVVDSCEAGTPTGTDATCDGVDNDCDASTDEAYASTATSCGVGACGATGATSCVSGAVVDSCEAGTPTGTDTTCDAVDDDCDGDVDEAYAPAATSCGVGACGSTGTTSCVSGVVEDSCEAGAATGTDADCDGVDNDCDATMDEGYAPVATTCGVGACGATGATSCVSGAVVDSCEAGTPTGTDATCNAVDDDCDGDVDEAFAPAATSCGVGACGSTGTTSCVSGSVVDSCEAGTPTGTDATCDGVDNDCDASTDEAYASTATSCGVGACGSTGATSCVSGAVVDSCEAGAPVGTDTTCNAVDEDCDGDVDEAFAPAATSCGVGACGATGATSCVAGTVVDSCEAGTPTGTDATCDGVDNDCDATVDEGYASTATSCGVGVCGATGATSCVSGVVVDSCEAGTPAGTDATCNAVDDDCDGDVDEAYAPVATSCGVGACGSTGTTSCVSGVVEDSCEAGAATGTDADCDGVDNDCDATVDEGYASTATSCGVGACGATGATTCVSGAVVDSCEAGTPTGTDASCNAVDDDCDGDVDEAYAPAATSCGVGACGSTGTTSCVSGSVVDSCEAGTPTGTDATCDGVDNDCDASTDEAYASTATSCGVGACGSTGATSCVSGAVVDSCEAGAPVGTDTTCNAVDDDCDGDVDEAYAPAATSCGVGACGSTGTTSCVSGSVVDSCEAGTPTGTDATCDGVDNDCDASTDEAYAPVATSCGVGACGATGVLACVAGQPLDTCSPGLPAALDDCGGVDDDCDGTLDEDCCEPMTCVDAQATCGTVSDGCGGTLSCGSCLAPEVCGAGGEPNVCGIDQLPPDPATIAPPAPTHGLSGTLIEGYSFLFEHDPPVQMGLNSSILDPLRVALVRGCVLDRTATPLSGVRVSILDRPEHGYTFTREDGCYDLILNGGGRVILQYTQDNYLPVQRETDIEVGVFAVAPTVVMVRQSTVSTVVPFGSTEPVVAVGETQVDEDGERTPVAYFPPGVLASTNHGGVTVPLSAGKLRMTEFTVGAGGVSAMPGTLPYGSLYTYAMDLSFDEVGPLETVTFNQDVYVYVDNFLELPVAAEVPNGHYDYRLGRWVPDVNGMVMQVVSVAGGVASLDADVVVGADSEAHLASLGLTESERRAIAEQYSVGESFWRMPMRHFTPADYNANGVLKQKPEADPPPTPGPAEPDLDCRGVGSVIYCHRRALGEDVPLAGTGMALHYQSDRARGSTADDRSFELDFTGMAPEPGATGLRVHVEVMGRVIVDETLPVTTERYVVEWDGRDAYGRFWNQPVVADYAIEWVIRPVYQIVRGASARRSDFGAGGTGCVLPSPCCVGGRDAEVAVFGGVADARMARPIITGDGEEARIYRSEHTRVLGGYSADRLGLGGFGLDVYHAYSPADGRLLLGSGDVIRPREVHSTIFAGGRSDGVTGRSISGPASRADLHMGEFSQVAMAPDGTVFFVQVGAPNAEEIWSITPGGELVPVLVSAAVTPSAWASWNALWPTIFTSRNLSVSHLATDARGRVYFVDVNPDNQLFRLTRSGTSWTVEHLAGASQGNLGTYTHWVDGESSKRSMSIRDMAVSSEGTAHLQIFSQFDSQIHFVEITPNSTIRRRHVPRQELGITGGRDGSIIVMQRVGTSNERQLVEVRMDGSFRVLAGGGSRNLSLYGDYLATELAFAPNSSTVPDSNFVYGDDGSLYFMLSIGSMLGVYRVDSNGVVSRYNLDDLGPPSFTSPFWQTNTGLSAGPGGSVLLFQRFAQRLVLYSDDLSGTQGIASADGSELYIFDSAGMHLKTVDAVSGVELLRFEHDTERRLTGVVDRYGRRTDFERVGSAILVHSPEGPGNERVTTTISLDSQGLAEHVEDPAGAEWSFRYDDSASDTEGLLLEMWAPRSNVPSLRSGPSYTFDYERFARFPGDDAGPWLLSRDTDPLGRTVDLEIPAATSGGQPGHRVVVAPTMGTWCDGTSYQVGWTVPEVTTTVLRHNGAMQTQLAASTGDGVSDAVTVVSPTGRAESRQEPGEDGDGSRTWPGGAFTYHVLPDPVVGNSAPYVDAGAVDIAAAHGRTALHMTVGATRTATLDPADLTFPYTVLSATETSTVNGTRTSTSQYSAATRTFTSTSPEGRVSQRIVDAQGRTIEARNPGQLPTYFDYDAQGYLMAVRRGTGPSERRVDYTYDARGYMNGLSTRVDPTRTVSVAYGNIDGRGQPRDTTVPGIGATMSMEPDVAGAPVSVSPPGQPAHGFEYSIVGQPTEYRPPGVAEVPNPASCPAGATCTVYDLERRIDQVVQADGQVLDMTYNEATGQLTSVDVPDDGTYSFSYDPTTGNLNTVTGPPGTVSVQTLWQSDLPIASISTGPVPGRVDVTYNNFLETSELAVTGGHGVRYTYDRDGLVVGTARVSGPSTAAMTLTRATLDGHVEQDVLGVVQTEYAVDVSASTPGYGDYEGSTVRVNGTPVYESHYEHDALGRITEWTETVEGSTRVQRFEYDDGGRLVSVRDGMDAPVADYGYDLNGNRTSVVEPDRVLALGVNLGCADSGGVPLARGANDRDELCRHGDHDYTYDTNGRLQTRVNVADPQDETAYTYDGGGRLQEVAHGSTTIEYVHDAFGRRVGRVVNGVFERGWLYKDSLNPIAQVNAAGVVEATYVYVTRANVPDYIVTTAGAVYRVVADHLGSVRMLVNATTGAVVERYDYDVWGRVTFESGDHSLHPFGYAGGLYDADTGLVRFGVRDYDADAGRWTAPEPLGFAAEANWYRYANGDPVNHLDLSGLAPRHWIRMWHGFRTLGRYLTNSQAISAVKRGQDVIVSSRQEAIELARRVGNSCGGGGSVVMEAPHPLPGALPHVHSTYIKPANAATGAARRTVRFDEFGHVFYRASSVLAAAMDMDDDGTVTGYDVLEFANPFPTSLQEQARQIGHEPGWDQL